MVPHGIEAEQLLYAQDDPVLLTDHQLAQVFNADVAAREIEAALALDDADLAQSFLDLARDRNVTVDPALVAKVDAANSTMASTRRAAKRFGRAQPREVARIRAERIPGRLPSIRKDFYPLIIFNRFLRHMATSWFSL